MKKHLLNIRKNCGLKKCGEEMGKQCIMLARGQEEKMAPGKPGVRENALVHDMAGSHTHTPKVTCPFPGPFSLVVQTLGQHAPTTPRWEDENFPPTTKIGPLHLRFPLRPPLLPSLPGSSQKHSRYHNICESSGWAFSLASGFRFMYLFACLLLTNKE